MAIARRIFTSPGNSQPPLSAPCCRPWAPRVMSQLLIKQQRLGLRWFSEIRYANIQSVSPEDRSFVWKNTVSKKLRRSSGSQIGPLAPDFFLRVPEDLGEAQHKRLKPGATYVLTLGFSDEGSWASHLSDASLFAQ